MSKYKVHPIDVDFAGWSFAEAGEHNAWGVVKSGEVPTLHAYYSVKVAADNRCNELNQGGTDEQ